MNCSSGDFGKEEIKKFWVEFDVARTFKLKHFRKALTLRKKTSFEFFKWVSLNFEVSKEEFLKAFQNSNFWSFEAFKKNNLKLFNGFFNFDAFKRSFLKLFRIFFLRSFQAQNRTFQSFRWKCFLWNFEDKNLLKIKKMKAFFIETLKLWSFEA